MKGGENVKKIAVVFMLACFMTAGLAMANDEKSSIPNTITSPELLGPHYIWTAVLPEDKTANETNIQDRVAEEAITPATEDRIKEVVDQQNH